MQRLCFERVFSAVPKGEIFAMSSAIEFWFDFSLPYAYLASLEIERRFSRFGKAIHWRPYLMGVAFQKTGMRSLSRSPLRGDYARHDWRRIANWTGVPFVLRKDHPFPSQLLASAYYWFANTKLDRVLMFAQAAFHFYFGEGRGLRSPEEVLGLADAYTDDLGSLKRWLDTDEARQVLRDRTAEAMDKGVFGSPYLLVDREPFWGWDRLPMAEAWLERQTPDNQEPAVPRGA